MFSGVKEESYIRLGRSETQQLQLGTQFRITDPWSLFKIIKGLVKLAHKMRRIRLHIPWWLPHKNFFQNTMEKHVLHIKLP
jgi:hypothetical protein